MLERNRLIQHAGNAECLSPEPIQNSNKKHLNKSSSGANLQSSNEPANNEINDSNYTAVNGKAKSTKYTENEQQSTSSASGVSSPDNNSRDDDSK